MDWTAQLKQEFRTALLGAYQDRAMLQDFVARLGEPDLDAAIASDRDLARSCADLLEYADSRGWLDRLYGEFVALHPERKIGQDPEARSAPLQLRRYRRKNQGFNEDLGEGVQLTMMRIPAGTFLMGAPVVSKFVLALPVPSSILPVPSRPATAPNPSLQVSPAALDCAIAPPKNPCQRIR